MDKFLCGILTIITIFLQCLCAQDTASQYIGCYKDDESNHAMTLITSDQSMTSSIHACLNFCTSNKYTFSGLKAASECHCGEDFTRHGLSGNCNTLCTDNSGDICGGEEALSVYSSCPPGTYGENCEHLCPFTCSTLSKKWCHVITGTCCYGFQNIPYCNFFNEEDCGAVDGDPREGVSDMPQSAGTWFVLFKTLFFPHIAEVYEIEYYTKRGEDTQYVSVWRNLKGNDYTMVAKLELSPTETGLQKLTMSSTNRIYVQKGDAIALHYPSSNTEANMIPYAQTNNLVDGIPASRLHSYAAYGFSGDSWNPGYTRKMSTVRDRRTAAIALKYNCIKECPPGKYGSNCTNDCHQCKTNDTCHFVDGTCPNGCATGYKGFKCDEECDENSYGQDCAEVCGNCKDHLPCHHISGHCDNGCNNGYQGVRCIEKCNTGFYGQNCPLLCGNCKEDIPCHHITGFCESGCKDGYTGDTCHDECDPGYYGPACSMKCSHCKATAHCDHINGYCGNGCDPGYLGSRCDMTCTSGRYGPNCAEFCGRCRDNELCDHVTGTCTNGCEAGYQGDFCNTTCPDNTYGFGCQPCSVHCAILPCDMFSATGSCSGNCESGYTGENCIEECQLGKYGPKCRSSCYGNCLGSCDIIDGVCKDGCVDGWTGQMCDISNASDSTDTLIIAVVIGCVVIAGISIITVGIVCVKRTKANKSKSLAVEPNPTFTDIPKAGEYDQANERPGQNSSTYEMIGTREKAQPQYESLKVI